MRHVRVKVRGIVIFGLGNAKDLSGQLNKIELVQRNVFYKMFDHFSRFFSSVPYLHFENESSYSVDMKKCFKRSFKICHSP